MFFNDKKHKKITASLLAAVIMVPLAVSMTASACVHVFTTDSSLKEINTGSYGQEIVGYEEDGTPIYHVGNIVICYQREKNIV